MAPLGAAAASRASTEELLDWVLRNGWREELRGDVAKITGAAPGLVDDALQDVCLVAGTTAKCRGQSRGEIYNWLRTATVRRTKRLLERAHLRHELLVDWAWPGEDLPQPAVAGAEVELLRRERERELAELVRGLVGELSEEQRRVAALHSRRVGRREIAARLGLSEWRVKRLKAEAYALLREALIEAAGGGCGAGERLVGRVSFGIAKASEGTQARLHMAGCGHCRTLYQRLEALHEKIAAVLPLPAAAQADPGLLERVVQKTADAVGQAKQQLVDAAGQAKQHATAGYTRAVEYTPLAGARPGAAATAIAGCLALGGGAAGYCIDRQVDPIAGLVDVVQARPDEQRSQEPASKPPEVQQAPDPPSLPSAPVEPVAAPEPVPSQPQPVAPTEPQPAAAPTPEPAPPPPPPEEEQFDPAAAAAAQPAPQPSSPSPQQPAPAPSSGVGEFLGGP